MKAILRNQKMRVFSLSIVLMSVLLSGVFMQSCSSDDDFVYSESNPDAKYLEAINSIESQNLQIVLESVFQTVKNIEGGCDIYIKVCEDVVTAIKAESKVQGAGSSKQLVRLKVANPETVAMGWTYLGEVSNVINATKLYNKYKNTWNYSCLELRLETVDNKVNVYVRQCT